MHCLRLAVENPPAPGPSASFNQFENAYSISELAFMVREVAAELGLAVEIRHYDNPRAELEEHYYQPDRQHLLDLGYEPTRDIKGVMKRMLLDLLAPRRAHRSAGRMC